MLDFGKDAEYSRAGWGPFGIVEKIKGRVGCRQCVYIANADKFVFFIIITKFFCENHWLTEKHSIFSRTDVVMRPIFNFELMGVVEVMEFDMLPGAFRRAGFYPNLTVFIKGFSHTSAKLKIFKINSKWNTAGAVGAIGTKEHFTKAPPASVKVVLGHLKSRSGNDIVLSY